MYCGCHASLISTVLISLISPHRCPITAVSAWFEVLYILNANTRGFTCCKRRRYRDTAEFLFCTEAKKLQARFLSQTEKYEYELQYVMKMKDKQFDDMMTSKDAKIMNLIDGTDFQVRWVPLGPRCALL